MSAVQFHCPLCDGLFQVDDSLAGIEVNCPHCQGLVTVPDFEGPPPPPADALQLSCPMCTGQFQVTPDMSGQEIACPHCYQAVTVPDLTGFQTALPPPPQSFTPNDYLPPQSPPLPPDPASLYPPGYLPPVGKSVAAAPAKTSSHWSNPPAESQEHPRSQRPLPAPIPTSPPPSAGDAFLPPTAGGAPARQSEPRDLLPPGAASGAATAERKPLPTTIPTRSPKDAVMIPTEQGMVGVRAPVKTIRHRGQEVELRQLTPEEKSRRRLVRNTILFLFCVITLIVVTAAFNWRK